MARLIGCNTIDPYLQVRSGNDYDLTITRRALEWLKTLGFAAAEYSHALHWSDEEVIAVREMTAEIGLYPWSLHAWAGGDLRTEEGRAQTERILRRAAEIALGLGVPYVVHHTSGETLAGDSGERLQAEAALLRSCWRPGFRWALETMFSQAHMEYLCALVDTLGPEIAGINVDTGHANLGDLGAARAIRLAGSRLVTTHLQDNHGGSDEHLPPGEGTIDWNDVAAALREIGYTGCLMLELTDQPPPDRRAKGVQEEMRRGAEKARWLAQQLEGSP